MTPDAPIAKVLPPPQGALEWLAQIPSAFDTQIFIMLLAAATAGMLANYFNKWKKGYIDGNLLRYLFFTNVRGTIISFSTIITTVLGLASSTSFFLGSGEFIGWKFVIGAGFGAGFVFDALTNKGQRAEWTDEKREAIAVVKQENVRQDVQSTVVTGEPKP